jgi:RimJ/RimL family protein N-acetyltransferase
MQQHHNTHTCSRVSSQETGMAAPPPHRAAPLYELVTGPRVLIRPFVMEDAEALYGAIVESRERLLPWMPWATGHQTVDETREYITRVRAAWQAGDDVNGGVFTLEGQHLLGALGLHSRNWEVPSFEIGYWVRTGAEGHGYIGEAVALITELVANDLGAQRIVIRCDVRNRRSAAVAERAGFVREGLLRNEMRSPSGDLRSTYVYSLTPDDARWPRSR